MCLAVLSPKGTKLAKQFVKKVLMLSTFFVCASLYSFSPSPESPNFSDKSTCLLVPSDTEKVHVKWVYDGDTVKLSDNRKIRIIGIDTPEVARKTHNNRKSKKKSRKAEPYAGQATETLRELLKKHNYRIHIKTDKQKKDKYGRLLAHVFTPDGINVSEWLLQQGLASLLVIPPNNLFLDCYRSAEKQAQNKKLKIWGLKPNQVQTTAALSKKYSGYVRLTGTVKRIKRRKNKISIQLDHEIYITIKKSELKLFKNLGITQLKGKTIQVTGILYRPAANRKNSSKGYIRVRHPVYLDY